MVNLAIAGGTGDVGRTIVEVLKGESRHRAVILTRKKPKGDDLGVPIVIVDYEDTENLKRALEENKIHTVICTFGMGDSVGQAQLNLIRASAASAGTKRFVPSNFAVAYSEGAAEDLPMLKDYSRAISELRRTDLEWTSFHNGVFLDYFAMPNIKTHLKPHTMVLDIANRAAALPGDGNARMTFTYPFDLARFVVASLDLEAWQEQSRVAGDTVTWNEFLKLAEETTGTKFHVVYDDVEKLQRGEITELPFHGAAYEHLPKESFQALNALFELWTLDPKIGVVPADLDAKFPDIRPLTVKGMLDKCWRVPDMGAQTAV